MLNRDEAAATLSALFTRLADLRTQFLEGMMRRWCPPLVFAATLATGGCDQPVSAPPVSQENQMSPNQSALAGDSQKRQADFLNRIRAADPEHRTIERAMLNEQNELGLILDRSVEMDRVPDLMRSILAQMA